MGNITSKKTLYYNRCAVILEKTQVLLRTFSVFRDDLKETLKTRVNRSVEKRNDFKKNKTKIHI